MVATVLILGGTREAALLAQRLAGQTNWQVISSLAGRTRRPAPLPGRIRVGGFGGSAGLADYLSRTGVDAVVDATHPFASTIAGHARIACADTGVARIKLLRPGWRPHPDDRWLLAGTMAQAGLIVRHIAAGKKVFLTIGRQQLEDFFRPGAAAEFLVRVLEPGPVRGNYRLIAARGPFSPAREIATLKRYRIDLLVCKNSGGEASYSKILAARQLGIPIVMVQRPSWRDDGALVTDCEAVWRWLAQRLRG